jgi:hypothetical protein
MMMADGARMKETVIGLHGGTLGSQASAIIRQSPPNSNWGKNGLRVGRKVI